ncbi:uncharacterized protein [Oscarella lobularis]|uniref:uncharacterized protein isoform X2 n=1 Tax=Oscarella lobularis TaxID=121494 RepID=UPI003313128F
MARQFALLLLLVASLSQSASSRRRVTYTTSPRPSPSPRYTPNLCDSFLLVCDVGVPFDGSMTWVVRLEHLPPDLRSSADEEIIERTSYDRPTNFSFTFDMSAYRRRYICGVHMNGSILWSSYLYFSVNSTVETNWLDFKDKVDCEITDDTPTPTSRSSGNNRATPSTSSPSPSTPPPPLPETNDTVGRPTVLQPTTQTDGFITPSIGSQSSGAPEWIYYVVPPLVLILVIVVVLLVYYKLRGFPMIRRKLGEASDLPGAASQAPRVEMRSSSADVVLTGYVSAGNEPSEKVEYAALDFKKKNKKTKSPPTPKKENGVQYADIHFR